MLDFDNYKPTIKAFVKAEVKRFVEVNPEVVLASAALYSHPVSGWVFLNFDSLENSQRFLQEWEDPDDAGWVGKDEDGFFNNNCPDYDFFEFGRIDFDEWTDEVEENSVIVLMGLGSKMQIDLEEDGDEALNKAFFSFFISIIEELEAEGAFNSLPKAAGFRLGVQMLDSEFESFWVSG